MTNENHDQESENTQADCSPCEKGTTMLVVGAGLGVYGTASFVVTGAICPACVIFAPAFLGYGAYKRMRFNKAKNGCDTCS